MADPTLSLAACAALERAINFALGLDSAIAQRFALHSGKTVRLYSSNPALTLHIQLGERCRVLYHAPAEADVALGGSLSAWAALARSDDKVAALVNGELAISGDSRILISLGELAGQLDIDWEAQLAALVGDVPANLAGRALRGASAAGSEVAGAAKTLLDQVIDQHEMARSRDNRESSESSADLVGDGLRALSEGLERIANAGKAGTTGNKGQ